MNIETLLGKDRIDISWRDLGACSGLNINSPDEDIFYNLYEESETKAKVTDEICMSCPVIRECYIYGRENKLEGVWGGVYLNPQGKVDRAKNRHKTERDWETIKNLHGADDE